MRQSAAHLAGEAEYFHQHDVELIEEMRRRAALEERRRRMAEASRIEDLKILETLERLGYDPTNVSLLHLVPLLQVAWSNGWMSDVERDCIVVIAGERGVNESAPAYPQLMTWLDRRPPEEFFWGTLRAIRAALESLPLDEQKACRDALLKGCQDVACASCGLLGWTSRICGAKRKLVGKIEKLLDPKRRKAASAAVTGSGNPPT